MSQTFGLGAWIQRLPPTQRADTLAVWRTALIVTLAIGLAKHVSFAAGLAGLAAAAAQLMIPLRYALTSDEGDDGIGYGFQGLRRDLPIVLGLLALTLIPFWFLHDLWWTLMGVSDGSGSTLAIPQGEASAWISQQMTLAGQALAALSMVEVCAIHLLGVALPEELFHRGYYNPSSAACSRTERSGAASSGTMASPSLLGSSRWRTFSVNTTQRGSVPSSLRCSLASCGAAAGASRVRSCFMRASMSPGRSFSQG